MTDLVSAAEFVSLSFVPPFLPSSRGGCPFPRVFSSLVAQYFGTGTIISRCKSWFFILFLLFILFILVFTFIFLFCGISVVALRRGL